MEPVVIGFLSLVLIVLMIYGGCYVAITLSLVSFLGVWIIKTDATIAVRMMTLAVTDTIRHYDYASIPTFVMMGLIVGKTGFGSDIYQVANQLFRRLRGGLGIATVAANAAFAAVTGSSIAAASVFTRVSVPEMIRFDYSKRFAVGVVAGSSVLGMIIPPSVMMIIYAFIAEQSVGDMFLAGVVPGLLLSVAYILAITAMTMFAPGFIGKGAFVTPMDDHELMSIGEMLIKIAPIVILIFIVLGGIYSGYFDAAEAGAIGAFFAYLLALLRRRIGWRTFREVLIDTGHITANILFLIIAASMYSAHARHRRAAVHAEPVARAYQSRLRHDDDVLRAAAAVPRHHYRHRLDHSGLRAVVPACDREHGAEPGVVRPHHRGRRRDRPVDAAVRPVVLRHQDRGRPRPISR